MRKLGLFIGAVLGTIAGVLFAPRSGKEMRKRIKEDIDKGGVGIDPLKEDAKMVGKDIAATFKEVKESEKVQKAVKKGKKKVNKMVKKSKKEVKAAYDRGHKRVKSELAKGKKKIDEMSGKAFSFAKKEEKKMDEKAKKGAKKK